MHVQQQMMNVSTKLPIISGRSDQELPRGFGAQVPEEEQSWLGPQQETAFQTEERQQVEEGPQQRLPQHEPPASQHTGASSL